jgi:hypothetical protein
MMQQPHFLIYTQIIESRVPKRPCKLGVVVHTIISATGEVEVGGLWLEASPSKFSSKPYLKGKLKAKRLGVWLKW